MREAGCSRLGKYTSPSGFGRGRGVPSRGSENDRAGPECGPVEPLAPIEPAEYDGPQSGPRRLVGIRGRGSIPVGQGCVPSFTCLARKSVMESRVQRLRIGPFRLVHQLQPGTMAERWLALNEQDESTHV